MDRPDVCRKTGNDLCQRSRHCSTGHRSWVRDKMTDPPVVSVDEGAQFVIPLLSGHVGGANGLARRIAEWLRSTPSDHYGNGCKWKICSGSVLRQFYHMVITDRKEAKKHIGSSVGRKTHWRFQ